MISMLESCSDVYGVEEEKIELHCQATRVTGGDWMKAASSTLQSNLLE